MASPALRKITREAKRLRKLHPHMEWRDAIQKASNSYNAGRLGRAISGTKPKRKAMKKAKRPRKVKTSTTISIGSHSIGKLPAATLLRELKTRINDNIDRLVVRKYHSTKKRDKKKIQKSITENKAKLRRLS